MRVAVVGTTYRPHSHVDVCVGKLLNTIPTDDGPVTPRLEVVSMYLDQVGDANDISAKVLTQHGVPLFNSVRQALTLGGPKLAVDGVLVVAEHGDYPYDELGRKAYPRRFMIEQILAVIASDPDGRRIPVWNDKYISSYWSDCEWVYDRCVSLGVPFLSSSSLPFAWRRPWFEYPLGSDLSHAVAVGYSSVEMFMPHALEALGCMVERRAGGEHGVRSLRCVRGSDVWQDEQPWWRQLAEAAVACVGGGGSTGGGGYGSEAAVDGPLWRTKHCAEPVLLTLEYVDGLRGAVLLLDGYVGSLCYAGTDRSDGSVSACEFFLSGGPNPGETVEQGGPEPSTGSCWTGFAHGSYQLLDVEECFLGCHADPSSSDRFRKRSAERCLLASGCLAGAFISLGELEGQELQTPWLAKIKYSLNGCKEEVLPRRERPTQKCLDTWLHPPWQQTEPQSQSTRTARL